MSSYEAFVGVRYLMGKRRTNVVSIITLISVFGVAVGVMAMIVVLSVMGGFEGDLKTKILGTKTHIVVSGKDGERLSAPDKLVGVAEGLEGEVVVGVSPFVESEVMISSPTNLAGVQIKGIDPEKVRSVSDLGRNLVDGDLSYLVAADKVRAGSRGLSDPDELDRILDELEAEYGLDPLDGDGTGRRVPGIDGVVYTDPDGRMIVDQGASAEFRDKFVLAPSERKGPPTSYSPPEPQRDPAPDYDPGNVAMLYPDDPDDGYMPPMPGQDAPAKGPDYDPGDVAALYPDDPDDGYMPPLPGEETPATTDALPPLVPAKRHDIPGIVIGRELKKSLQVDIGSEVNIVSPQGDMGPTGPIPRSRPFKVVGIFYSGMYEYDTKYVYMSIPSAQEFLNYDAGEVTGVEIKTYDVDEVTQVKGALEAALAQAGLGEGVEVRDWKDMNSNLFFALKLEKVVMFIILIFIILVASFSIVCNLIMVVIEKAREIAILKGMGATDGGVMRIFILEGTIIGVAGTMLGLVLGVACCLIIEFYGINLDPDVYYINTLPVEMNPLEVALIAVSGIAISAAATLYPSIQAARLTPVDGLRYD